MTGYLCILLVGACWEVALLFREVQRTDGRLEDRERQIATQNTALAAATVQRDALVAVLHMANRQMTQDAFTKRVQAESIATLQDALRERSRCVPLVPMSQTRH